MDSPIKSFEIGRRYSHEEVYHSLSVGNAGGIRPCMGKDGEVRRLVVMTTVPDARILRENPYHDRIEGDILVYTAAGLEGNQSVVGINRRLIEQLTTPFPIYSFSNTGNRRNKDLGRKRWEFLGLLQYIRHYRELQVDAHDKAREAWVFELLIHREMKKVAVGQDMALSAELVTNSRSVAAADEEDRIIAVRKTQDSSIGTASRAIETESVRRKMLALKPEGFEHLIKTALELTGFKKVTVTRYTQDGGIDVNAYVGDQVWPVRDL